MAFPEKERHNPELLKTNRLKLGLVINFGSHPKLEWKRLVL
jgi:hypothetical protein